jgi:hypothetical protein
VDLKKNPNGKIKTILGHVYTPYTAGTFCNLPRFNPFGSPRIFDVVPGKEFVDRNITTNHQVDAYIDAYDRIRLFYIDGNENISAKVSDDIGCTWRQDMGV